MRVCIVATGYPRWKGDVSSAKNYLHTLAKSLVRKGIEIHVVAPHADGLKKEEIMDGVHIHRFQYLYPSNLQTLAYFPGVPEKIKTIKGKLQLPFFMLAMIEKMLDVVKDYEIDVINAHWAIPPGFIATFTKIFHKKPVVIRIYGAELFPFIGKKGLSAEVAKWMIKRALNTAERVVGNSNTTCVAGNKISGREDLEVLPEGVDTENFNPEVNGEEIKKRHNLNNCFSILSSGRMVERKGFRYLIEAMPYVLESFPKTALILGGDGPERKNLVKLAFDLGIRENVIFPGFIQDKEFPNYMKASDVFVLPSIVDKKGDTEGLGLVLAEALACGTPVIGTKVGGIPDIIKDGVGFLVEQKNPSELADRITMLLTDENLRKEMGKRGRRYIEENFRWESISERYCSIFEETAKR